MDERKRTRESTPDGLHGALLLDSGMTFKRSTSCPADSSSSAAQQFDDCDNVIVSITDASDGENLTWILASALSPTITLEKLIAEVRKHRPGQNLHNTRFLCEHEGEHLRMQSANHFEDLIRLKRINNMRSTITLSLMMHHDADNETSSREARGSAAHLLHNSSKMYGQLTPKAHCSHWSKSEDDLLRRLRKVDGLSVKKAISKYNEIYPGRHEKGVQSHIYALEFADKVPCRRQYKSTESTKQVWTVAEEAQLYKLAVLDNLSTSDAAEALVKQYVPTRSLAAVKQHINAMKRGDWRRLWGRFPDLEGPALSAHIVTLAETELPNQDESANAAHAQSLEPGDALLLAHITQDEMEPAEGE